MSQLKQSQKTKVLEKVREVLQADQLPFVNLVLLVDDSLVDVYYVEGGWPNGTLQVRIDNEGRMTFNLSWSL